MIRYFIKQSKILQNLKPIRQKYQLFTLQIQNIDSQLKLQLHNNKSCSFSRYEKLRNVDSNNSNAEKVKIKKYAQSYYQMDTNNIKLCLFTII